MDIYGLDFLTACLFRSLFSCSVCWVPSPSCSLGGQRTSAASLHLLLKHRASLLEEQSHGAFSVYLIELSVIFQIKYACKRRQSHFLPAGFLKSPVGKSTYRVFGMNRKLSLMTGILESIAANAAVENVTVDGTNRIQFWARPRTISLWYWSKWKKRAIGCLKNGQVVGCKCIRWNKNIKVFILEVIN